MKFVTGAAIAFALVLAAVVGGVVWQQTRASAVPLPDPAEVRITPATINIPEGATGTVELGVFGLDADENLATYSIQISYNPTIVDATACTFELAPSCNVASENNNLGSDTVASSSFGGEFGTGDIPVATIEFKALAGQAGNCTNLTISGFLEAISLFPIAHNTINGEICVTAGPTPSPTLTGERGTVVLTEPFGSGRDKGVSGVVTFANEQPDTDYTATFVSTDVLCRGQMVTDKTTTGFRAVCRGRFASATIDWVVIR